MRRGGFTKKTTGRVAGEVKGGVRVFTRVQEVSKTRTGGARKVIYVEVIVEPPPTALWVVGEQI